MVGSKQATSGSAPNTAVRIADREAAMVAAARGDRSAFEPLYLKYIDLIYRYCRRRLGDREMANDATSQIFENVLIALPSFRADRSTFRSWLFAIAHNVVVDLERARRPQHNLEDAAWIIDPRPGPEDNALATEGRQEVQVLLAAVPLDQRRILELRFAGLRTTEIAESLACSEGAVRASQYRAITRLRLVLGLAPHRTGGPDA